MLIRQDQSILSVVTIADFANDGTTRDAVGDLGDVAHGVALIAEVFHHGIIGGAVGLLNQLVVVVAVIGLSAVGEDAVQEPAG